MTNTYQKEHYITLTARASISFLHIVFDFLKNVFCSIKLIKRQVNLLIVQHSFNKNYEITIANIFSQKIKNILLQSRLIIAIILVYNQQTDDAPFICLFSCLFSLHCIFISLHYIITLVLPRFRKNRYKSLYSRHYLCMQMCNIKQTDDKINRTSLI